VRGDGEIVLDRTLASDHGIRVGDSMTVQGQPLRVVGLSARTRTFIGGGLAFVSLNSAGRLFGETGTATFILVRTADPARVGSAITARTGLAADPPGSVAQNERAAYANLGHIFNLVIVIAFAAGTLMVALTVYSAIVDRLREYGIAKAMGARWLRLFRIVAGQTLLLAAAGTALGFGLFALGSWLLVTARPQFPSSLTPGSAGGVVVAAGAMALLAAVLPTRQVARLDPASVYRG
jgi:putative ABC transport system permease protein